MESAFLLKRPKRSLLVIASAALSDLAISETWAAAADVGCALCEITGDPIGYERLKFRPVTTLSIAAKEEAERLESEYIE